MALYCKNLRYQAEHEKQNKTNQQTPNQPAEAEDRCFC